MRCRCSRVVVEVVVHGDGSGSSGSCFEEELDGFESLRGCRGTCGLGDGSRSRSERNLAFRSIVELNDPGGVLGASLCSCTRGTLDREELDVGV